MTKDLYRYSFTADAPIDEVETSLLLAVLATAGLGGYPEPWFDEGSYLQVARNFAHGQPYAGPAADAEDKAAKRFTDWKHPFSNEQRRKVGLELEALYRVPMDDPAWGSASYIEAVKRYPVRPWDDGCGLVTSISGWIRRSPKGEVKYDLSARITYCDRKGVTYMFPLGAVKAGGRTFWVFQTSGWTGEWYSIVRPSPKGVEYHVDYFAGRGCDQ